MSPTSIFANVKMRALVQSVRFYVFTIVDSLLSSHRGTLKEMGSIFLSGYVNLATGEKDPRNLMLAFAIARVLLVEFDTSAHTEVLSHYNTFCSMFNPYPQDFFDITFCYFPITFRPPPDNPYDISADDLKQSLRFSEILCIIFLVTDCCYRLCLSATPALGLLGIPVFLEKLTAGLPTTKVTILLLHEVLNASLIPSDSVKLYMSCPSVFQYMDLLYPVSLGRRYGVL